LAVDAALLSGKFVAFILVQTVSAALRIPVAHVAVTVAVELACLALALVASRTRGVALFVRLLVRRGEGWRLARPAYLLRGAAFLGVAALGPEFKRLAQQLALVLDAELVRTLRAVAVSLARLRMAFSWRPVTMRRLALDPTMAALSEVEVPRIRRRAMLCFAKHAYGHPTAASLGLAFSVLLALFEPARVLATFAVRAELELAVLVPLALTLLVSHGSVFALPARLVLRP
jgi:hypothetical protein